jgi:alpha-L-rhamnosidase
MREPQRRGGDVAIPHRGLHVEPVRVEHHREPLGIGEARPRLSWTVAGASADPAALEAELRFRGVGGDESHRIPATDGVLVPWPFGPLQSRHGGELTVRISDGSTVSEWSTPTWVEAGLLEPRDWLAQAIGPAREPAGQTGRPTLLRTEFTIEAAPVRARLYATAHGLFQFEINGKRVGTDELAPGWTSYHHRLRYITYDVTDLLATGGNAIGAWLADGWYRGRLGFHGGHANLYGDQTALFAQLEIDLADGSRYVVPTDRSWRTAPAPILRAGLLDGETFDARAVSPGWSRPGFDADTWPEAAGRHLDPSLLVAPHGPPVRATQELPPVSTRRTDDGRLIVDFGQNLVGRVRIRAGAEAGHTVHLRHAEVLTPAGELDTRPLRGAAATDEYTFAGDGDEEWEPRFTVHGFRYAEITGWPTGSADGVVARVLHTDMRRTGTFRSSDERLNRLHDNVVWSMRGNFVDLPTDCPQRDERLGWTGDIQVFAPTAAFLYDCTGLLTSWLEDVAAEQYPDGTVPWYVPEIPGGDQWTPARPGAGWGDAVALVPWALYRETGDVEILRRQFGSARAWSDLQHRLAGPEHVWDTGYQLGDWLDPSAPPDDPAHGLTDPYLVATAYYHRTADVVARMAAILGDGDASELRERAWLARDGFRRRYRVGPGRLSSESQAAYAIAIMFGLFDADEIPEAGRRLAALVRAADTHLTTGFLGTPLLLDALTETGQYPLAIELLRQDTVPSWLYPVSKGATTVWERWDSMLPNGAVNPGEMTSFNHYAFGAVADWMHRRLAGLEADEPGWRSIRLRPGLESGLRSASAVKVTPRGIASIAWRVDGSDAQVDVVVPNGCRAELVIGGRVDPLGPGTHHCALRRDDLGAWVS